MYEKWGADFLVAEGAEAGGHIGDIDLPLPSLVEEVLRHTSLPVVAAGGIDGQDVARFLGMGVAGVQLATRFIACSDGDAHPSFKEMHLGKNEERAASRPGRREDPRDDEADGDEEHRVARDARDPEGDDGTEAGPRVPVRTLSQTNQATL